MPAPRLKRSKKPSRRVPSQSRAQETLELILAGTRAVLVERGYGGTTTNHIAERAGISIGSFYQYFDGKEDAIRELLGRHHQEGEALLAAELGATRDLGLREQIERTVHAIFTFHCERYELCNVFYNELPRDGAYQSVTEHFDRSARIIEMFLTARKDEVRITDPRMAADIVVHAMVGAFFGTDRKLKEKAQRARFHEEIRDMVTLYLLGD
jgi:AcrR family transcriptional regulator